jgi:peptidoglycan hydrolase CwlO-like protein
MNLIPSSAQTGKPSQDTVKCYGLTELRYIASTIVEARACDTSLLIANAKLANRDTFILELKYEIDMLNKSISLRDSIITDKEEQIVNLKLDIYSKEKEIKWLKFGWKVTSIFLGGTIIYAIFH